ncbi:MAG: hypothetical protein QOH29_2008 [Actinomycetota bacterium]|nr:hypothetical protein [Actinomycetota bacterium]
MCHGVWHVHPLQSAIKREGFVSPVAARTSAQSQSGHVSTYMICTFSYRRTALPAEPGAEVCAEPGRIRLRDYHGHGSSCFRFAGWI